MNIYNLINSKFTMIHATLCFLRSEGKTLFLFRSKEGDIHKGWHVPPGGKTERGERGVDCVVREFKEETGLTLINPKLRIIATFYNEGRVLGGKENPEDWKVEVYEAGEFSGQLKEEHPKAKLEWIEDKDLESINMYPGDRKIMELLREDGVFEVITQYSKENLIKFEHSRVI